MSDPISVMIDAIEAHGLTSYNVGLILGNGLVIGASVYALRAAWRTLRSIL